MLHANIHDYSPLKSPEEAGRCQRLLVKQPPCRERGIVEDSRVGGLPGGAVELKSSIMAQK
jgi:hypothetical protein